MNYSQCAEPQPIDVAEHAERQYDLDERLIEFASLSVDITEKLPNSKAGNHIAGQLVRSGTSPAPNYGEALACESRKDFVHKMGVCLKELRESRVWLRIIKRRQMVRLEQLPAALTESEELVRIFNTSIRTARNNEGKKNE